MPREQTRNVSEIRTKGRKGGANKADDDISPPQKKIKIVSPPKAQKIDQKGIGRKKNHGTINEDLDIDSNKNEKAGKPLNKVTTQDEALSKNEDRKDNVKAERKRKIEETKDEAAEDREGKISEDKNKASKVPLRKKRRSKSSSEKEDTSKETESKVPIIDRKEGNREMGLRRTRNTRRSESFSSDGEMEKRNSADIHTDNELDKQEDKTVHKNKSAKETEKLSSDGEKNMVQQHVSDISTHELGKQGTKSIRQTRNTRQTENLSSDRETDLKQQDTTDTSTDNDLVEEDEKIANKTRNTRRAESLSSDGEKDVKQQNATDTSSDNEPVQQRVKGVRKIKNTRQTESLSSDGKKDIKHQNKTDISINSDLVQRKVKGALRKTRNTRQPDSLSSDGEKDNKRQNAADPSTNSELVQVEKGVRKMRNTRRTESLSSERETDLEQHQNITTTVEDNELDKREVEYAHKTRNTRRSRSYSSDKEKDIKQQNENNVLIDKDLKKRGRKSVKSRISVQSESCSSDIDHSIDSDRDNKIVVEASNTNVESLNDAGIENVNKAKDKKIKYSLPRTRRAKRIEDSSSDRESEKTQTDQNEHEMELNRNESEINKNDSKNQVSLYETRQSKPMDSNSDGEDRKNEDGIFSYEGIKMSNDMETDTKQDKKCEEAATIGDKTRNAGRDDKESHSQVKDDKSLSDEEKKSARAGAVGQRMKNGRKLKGNAKNHPHVKDSVELNDLEVIREIKEKSSARRGGRKLKNTIQVEHESDLQDKDGKELSGKETDNEDECKKETDIALVKTRNAGKGKNKTDQQDKDGEELNKQKFEGEQKKKMERKTRNTNKKEKDTFTVESNEESLQDDTANETIYTEYLETHSVEKQIAHRITTSRMMPVSRATKSYEGSDMESCKTDDGISDNKIAVSDSSNAETISIGTSKERRTSPIDFEKESTLGNMTYEVQIPNQVATNALDNEQNESFPLVSRDRKRRGRDAKIRVSGKMSTRSIKKFSEGWKKTLSSETNQTTEIENRESENLSGHKEIADTSFDILKSNIQMFEVSVVIHKLDLNDPLICKQISDCDLQMLKTGKGNFEQGLKSSSVEYQNPGDKYSKKMNEPCEIPHDVEMVTSDKKTNSIAAFENKTGHINLTMCHPMEVTKESCEVTGTKDAQQSPSTGIDSFNTSEITFESSAEKATFDSIVERYVIENVNIGNVDPENKFPGELSCINPSPFKKSVRLDEENSESDQNAAHGKNTVLEVNYPEDQESENTEIDGSEIFSDNLSTNLDLETLTNKNDDLENISPSGFLRNDIKVLDENITNEPGIDDFKIEGETVNKDGTSESGELLEIEEFENNKSEEGGEAETEFTDLKKSSECEDVCNENSVYLESIDEYVDKGERNEKLNELENSVLSESESSSEVSNSFVTENDEEIKIKNDGCIAKNENHVIYDENNKKSIFMDPLDEEMIEAHPEEIGNSLKESIFENKGKENSNSGTFEDQRKILNTEENSVILTNFEESKLVEMDNKSEENDQDGREAESEMHDKVDSKIESTIEDVESVSFGANVSTEVGVNQDKEYAEEDSMHDENTENEISVEVYNVHQDQKCSVNEGVIENVKIFNESNKGIVCKSNVENFKGASNMKDEKVKDRSLSTSMSIPQENAAATGANSEESLNDDSDVVLEISEVENSSDQVNENSLKNENFVKPVAVCTKESQADAKVPIVITTEKIKTKQAKTDLNRVKVQTKIKKIDYEEKDKAVEQFMASDLQGSEKCAGIPQQIDKDTDSETHESCVKKIQMGRTSDIEVSSETDKCEVNTDLPKVPSKIKNAESVEKGVESFIKISPCDQNKSESNSVDSQSNKSSMKPKNTEVKLTSAPRWPRMPYAPVRKYLEQFIPLLLEGLLTVSTVRPNNPIQYLADWIEENKEEAYYIMKENLQKDSRKRIVYSSDKKQNIQNLRTKKRANSQLN